MHWLVAGPGALGLLYAGLLAKAGNRISLWGRSGPLPAQDYELETPEAGTLGWQSQALASKVDAVLVVTKIFQSDRASQAILASGKVQADCPLILLHNGLGAGENLARLSPDQPLLLASSRHGALKLSNHKVRHTGVGCTQLGLYRGLLSEERQQQLIQPLAQATGNCEWHDKIQIPLWHKLIINSVINPLTAREGIANGCILESKYRQELISLCEQACLVAQLEGVSADSELLLHQILQVANATARNHSSMLQDLEQHRKTEIDYINGYLLRCAKKHQLSIPAHTQIVEQIHQLEKEQDS